MIRCAVDGKQRLWLRRLEYIRNPGFEVMVMQFHIIHLGAVEQAVVVAHQYPPMPADVDADAAAYFDVPTSVVAVFFPQGGGFLVT